MALVRRYFHRQARHEEGLDIAMVHTIVQRNQRSSRYVAVGREVQLVAAQKHPG